MIERILVGLLRLGLVVLGAYLFYLAYTSLVGGRYLAAFGCLVISVLCLLGAMEK